MGTARVPRRGGALLLISLRAPDRAIPLLVFCLAAFASGVLLRENRLTSQVPSANDACSRSSRPWPSCSRWPSRRGRARSGALDRVVRRTHGELSIDLRRVLAEVRTGTPVARAFDDLAARTGLPVVARFAEGLAIAVERGTPLADVLHAQAADVREAGRRALIEAGARKEVLMMVPVVFVVLPVTVVFAFWPGLVGLRLVTP